MSFINDLISHPVTSSLLNNKPTCIHYLGSDKTINMVWRSTAGAAHWSITPPCRTKISFLSFSWSTAVTHYTLVHPFSFCSSGCLVSCMSPQWERADMSTRCTNTLCARTPLSSQELTVKWKQTHLWHRGGSCFSGSLSLSVHFTVPEVRLNHTEPAAISP